MAEFTEQAHKVKIQQRTSLRANVTKEIKKVDPLFAAIPPESKKAPIILGQLKDFQMKFNAQISTNMTCSLPSILFISNCKTLLRPIEPMKILLQVAENRDIAPKLPKLQITTYRGDPLLWDEFWDDFKSSIHNRDGLPIIDKFKYLKSFLDDDALRLADGYRLTVANYDAALSALKEGFGDPQVATHAHFEALIALPAASHALTELRTILDKCESHIRSLVALGLPETTFGVVFTPLILSKLPRYVKMELHRKNGSQPWNQSNLRLYLKEKINAREKSERPFAKSFEGPSNDSSKVTKSKFKGSTQKPRPTSTAALSSPVVRVAPEPPGCAFCSAKHFSGQCQKYPDLVSSLKRIKGHCRSCLRKNHQSFQCRAKRLCYHCRKEGHHQSLCPQKFGTQVNETEGRSAPVSDYVRADTSRQPSRAHESNLSLQTPNSKSILQTAVGTIRGGKGNLKARFYFDTGSSPSFITTKAAKLIGTKYVGEESVSVGRFRDSKRSIATYKISEFDVCFPNGETKTVRMSGENTISCPIQLISLQPSPCSILSSVKLAEPLVNESKMVSIDILIGRDYYYSFIGPEQVRCSNGIVLLSSPFRFVVAGTIEPNGSRNKLESSLFVYTISNPNRLHSIDRFWSLEEIGIKDEYTRSDDEAALKSFHDSVQFKGSRYHVKWPWKDQFPDLPDNYSLALGRLGSLLKQFQPNKELMSTYDETIANQMKAGIIEVVPKVPDGAVHYIVHHCVITPTKSTTKLRIVYDASAKAGKDTLSLNECLHRGPVFLSDSVGLIFRALTNNRNDQHTDRDVTRFLWLKDVHSPATTANIQAYRFCRIPFGIISSPFLLAATVDYHLRASGSAVAGSFEKTSTSIMSSVGLLPKTPQSAMTWKQKRFSPKHQ